MIRNPRTGKKLSLEPPEGLGRAKVLVHPDDELSFSKRDLDLERDAAAARERTHVYEETRNKQEALREQVRVSLQELKSVGDGIDQVRRDLYQNTAEEVVELAFAIAKRVLRMDLEHSADSIQPLVEDLLARVAGAHRVVVRMSARDLEFLRECDPTLEKHPHIRYQVDDKVIPGGCVVESETETWDAQVDTQLQRIEDALRGELRSQREAA